MKISDNQDSIIDYIMGLTYYDYQCPWCKVQDIEELKTLSYQKNVSLIDKYLAEPSLLENQQQLRHVFLEDVLYNYTPESFLYYKMLKYEWTVVNSTEHQEIVDKMLKRIQTKRQKYAQEAQNKLLEYLANWELTSVEEYEKAPQSLKEEIHLESFAQMFGYSLTGIPDNEDTFTDYAHLSNLFLNKLFDKETVHFFVNVSPSKVEEYWDAGEMPAVIGMDNQIIGVFWWND